jgi:integrase
MTRGACVGATVITDEFVSEIRVALATGNRLEVSDGIEPGLRLRLGPRGARWSVLTNGVTGKRSRVDLGSWPKVNVNQARERARRVKCDNKRFSGSDWSVITVGSLLDRYSDSRIRQLRQGPSTLRSLQRLLEGLSACDVRGLTHRDVRQAVGRLAEEAPVHANRSLSYCKALFSWAVAQGHMQSNPAAAVARPIREKPRNRALSLDELVEIWDAAELLGYPFGQIIRLLILTAAPRSDVGGMRAQELDLPAGHPNGRWMVPSERAKLGRAICIPLSPLARRVVEQALDWRLYTGDLVFTTNGEEPVSGWSKAKSRLDRLIEMSRREQAFPSWQIQDLRRSFARVASLMMRAPKDVVDACLNRGQVSKGRSASIAEGFGPMFDERKQVLEGWAVLIEAKLRKQSTIGGGTVL